MTFTDQSSNKDYKDPLGSNESRPSKAPTGSSQALLPAPPALDIIWYI